MTSFDDTFTIRAAQESAAEPDDIVALSAAKTTCRYPEAICEQLRWLQRRVFYQFLQTGCPTIDMEADLSIARNQADLRQRLQVSVPELQSMPTISRGSVQHGVLPPTLKPHTAKDPA